MKGGNLHFIIRAIFLIVVLSIYGCTDIGERGLKVSEPELMKELERELTDEGILLRRSQDGFLMYDAQNEELVRRLLTEVQRKLSGGIAVKYGEEAMQEILVQLLISRGMEYRVESRDGGEWIRWYPENDSQKKEIEMKVFKNYFDTRYGVESQNCIPQELPC